MVISRTVVEPNAAFAGMTLEASFARLRALIATFSEESVPSCLSGRWDPVAMVENQGDCEKAARRADRGRVRTLIKTSVHPVIARPALADLLITVALKMRVIS